MDDWFYYVYLKNWIKGFKVNYQDHYDRNVWKLAPTQQTELHGAEIKYFVLDEDFYELTVKKPFNKWHVLILLLYFLNVYLSNRPLHRGK